MIKTYKSIIRDILEPEASKRGFVYSSGRRMIATKPLAYYDRIVEGKKQGYEIIQDLIDDGTVIFRGFGVEKNTIILTRIHLRNASLKLKNT